MGSFSLMHWVIVLLVVMLLFGGGRISGLMGDVAKGIKSFKKGMADDEDDASAAKPATRIEGHRQAVESIEARLNTLKTLSDTVDRKLKEQLGGRTGVDGKLLKELSSQIAATDR